METIYSDGKTLEIERKLKITVYLPQLCYFCGEEITKLYGRESESLCFHSLDGNHDNWDPSNKVPSHYGCHSSFHQKGLSKPWMRGDGNPMRCPEVAAKQGKTLKGRPHPWQVGDKNPMANPVYRAKITGENNPMYGKTHTEEARRKMSNSWTEERRGEQSKRITEINRNRRRKK